MSTKVKELSDGAKSVLEVLENSEKALTLAEIKKTLPSANSSHLTALKNRGMVTSEPTEKLVTTVAKRTVNIYSAVEIEEVA